MERRRSIRDTPYRLRAQGRSAKEKAQQRERVENGMTCVTLSTIFQGTNPRVQFILFWLGIAYLLMYDQHRRVLYRHRRWQWRPPPTFGSLDPLWCWHHLRFRKKDLWRISEALLLPQELELDNGSWTNNQEMLIVLLLRLGSTDKWLDLESLIHIEYSRMSRVWKATIEHCVRLWWYKLNNNWQYFSLDKLLEYRSAMRRKLRRVFGGGNVLPARYRDCFASIDCKRFDIARPSGPNNQQTFLYNTYYGSHNLAFQSVVSPNGLILHFSGPHAGSGNDLNVLADSGLLPELRTAMQNAGAPEDLDLDLVADKIYNIAARGIASIRQNPANNLEQLEDTAASKIRVPNEWNFGKIVRHFPFINYYMDLKLNEREIGSYITVAALLTKIHTCLYGSACGDYFSEPGFNRYAPELEDDMNPY